MTIYKSEVSCMYHLRFVSSCMLHNKTSAPQKTAPHSRATRLRLALRRDGDAAEQGDLDGTEGDGAENEAHFVGGSQQRRSQPQRLTLRPRLRGWRTRPAGSQPGLLSQFDALVDWTSHWL